MKTLDWYLFRKLLLSFAGVMFLIILVVLIAEVRDIYGDILSKDPDLKWVVIYLGLILPGRIAEVTPLAMAISSLWVLAWLARRNELLAFFCGGISPSRLSLPFLGLGVLLSATLLTANESLLYRTEETARYVFRVYVRNEGKIQITRGGRIHQKGVGRRFYSMDRFIRGSQEMIRPTILELYEDAPTPRLRLDGARAYQLDSSDGSLWRFNDVTLWRYRPDGSVESMERLEQMDILLEKDLDTFLSETGKPNELNFLELKEYIQARQRRGLKTPRLLTELHLKIAFPMAPFVLTLLVCSFALSPRAGWALVRFGSGSALVLLYYAALLWLRKMGHREILPPEVAAWAPNGVFLLLGGVWFLRSLAFQPYNLSHKAV